MVYPQSNLKKLLLAFTLAMLGACVTEPQDKTETTVPKDTVMITSPRTDSVVTLNNMGQIRKAYAIVKAAQEAKELDSTTFRYNCDGERSGTVTYFSKDGILKMIAHNYAEYDHNELSDHYFVNDGKPFFVHLRSLSWAFDNGPEGATKDKVTERRIYIINAKAINCYEKKYEIQKHKGINPKPEDIPNKEVDCASITPIIEKYQQLAKYWKVKSPECL